MRHIAAISGLIIIGIVSTAMPAPAETNQNEAVIKVDPVRWVGVTTFDGILREPKVRLSTAEIRQIAFKVGRSLRVGYGTVGYSSVGPRNVQRPQILNTASPRQAMVQSNSDNNQGPMIRKTSPSSVDISGEPPGMRRVVREEGATYDPILRQRALELYPSDRQARLLWMAVQEQQAIQNQINSSKPLIYPVGSR